MAVVNPIGAPACVLGGDKLMVIVLAGVMGSSGSKGLRHAHE